MMKREIKMEDVTRSHVVTAKPKKILATLKQIRVAREAFSD